MSEEGKGTESGEEGDTISGGGASARGAVDARPVEAYKVADPITATATAEPKGNSEEKKPAMKWVHGFWDICYTNKEESNTFCPYFCPFACPFSCIMTGVLVTKLSGNEALCLEMDGNGIACCVGSGVTAYFAGGLFCCIHAMFYRNDLVYKYNVDTEKDTICCQCFDVFIRGVCYPCSYYQMYNSIKAWENKEAVSMVTDAANVTNKSD